MRSARYLVDQLTADAVAGGVQGRREGGQPTFAGCHRDDASAHAALSRNPDLVQPVSRQLVQTGGGHDREDPPAHAGRDDTFTGLGVDPAVRECCPHRREVVNGDLQGALARVDVGGCVRVEVEPAVAVQQVRDAVVAHVRAGLGRIHVLAHAQLTAGEAREPVTDALELLVGRGAWYQAGRRDRTRVDERVHRSVVVQLDGHQRVERKASAVHAEVVPRGLVALVLAHQGEDERLGNALDREEGVDVADLERPAPGADHGDAEQVWGGCRQAQGCSRRRLRRRSVGSGGRPQ